MHYCQGAFQCKKISKVENSTNPTTCRSQDQLDLYNKDQLDLYVPAGPRHLYGRFPRQAQLLLSSSRTCCSSRSRAAPVLDAAPAARVAPELLSGPVAPAGPVGTCIGRCPLAGPVCACKTYCTRWPSNPILLWDLGGTMLVSVRSCTTRTR